LPDNATANFIWTRWLSIERQVVADLSYELPVTQTLGREGKPWTLCPCRSAAHLCPEEVNLLPDLVAEVEPRIFFEEGIVLRPVDAIILGHPFQDPRLHSVLSWRVRQMVLKSFSLDDKACVGPGGRFPGHAVPLEPLVTLEDVENPTRSPQVQSFVIVLELGDERLVMAAMRADRPKRRRQPPRQTAELILKPVLGR
jgi:hypothetical protein